MNTNNIRNKVDTMTEQQLRALVLKMLDIIDSTQDHLRSMITADTMKPAAGQSTGKNK